MRCADESAASTVATSTTRADPCTKRIARRMISGWPITTARTCACSDSSLHARAMISGPTPVGSPIVIASMSFHPGHSIDRQQGSEGRPSSHLSRGTRYVILRRVINPVAAMGVIHESMCATRQ